MREICILVVMETCIIVVMETFTLEVKETYRYGELYYISQEDLFPSREGAF